MKLNNSVALTESDYDQRRAFSERHGDNEDDDISDQESSVGSSEDEHVDKIELMRNLMEKQLSLSEREQNFANKIRSLKSNLEEPKSFGNIGMESKPESRIANHKDTRAPQVPAKPTLGNLLGTQLETNETQHSISKTSKKTQNPFALKFQEHLLKRGLTQVTAPTDPYSSQYSSLYFSNAESEVDFENIRCLNFFFEGIKEPNYQFAKNEEPQVYYEEDVPLFQGNMQLAKQNRVSNTPVNFFDDCAEATKDPSHFQPEGQELESPASRTKVWNEHLKYCGSESMRRDLESLDSTHKQMNMRHPYEDSMTSDSFDYYQDERPNTHEQSECVTEYLTSNNDTGRFKKTRPDQQNSDLELSCERQRLVYEDNDGYGPRDQVQGDHNVHLITNEVPSENFQSFNAPRYSYSDCNHYNMTYFRKHYPEYVQDMMQKSQTVMESPREGEDSAFDQEPKD
jgi:hypothetical protein